MFRNIYAVENQAQLAAYQSLAKRLSPAIDAYIGHLQERYEVRELPGAVVWTGKEIATSLLSNIPVPAYTNEFRIVFCPEKDVWREIYRAQWDGGTVDDDICGYYDRLTERNVLQILGHELAHHSLLFADGYQTPGCGPWFEEGMVEYISRRYFLRSEEFAQEARVNRLLVARYEAAHGRQPLERFTEKIYRQGLDTVFYWYWRSYLAVAALIEQAGGDEMAVFHAYDTWRKLAVPEPLSVWLSRQRPDWEASPAL